MSSAVITRNSRKPVKRQVVAVWDRTSLPALVGSADAVSWAYGIRSVTISKLPLFAEELAREYRQVSYGQRAAFESALTDVLYEIAAQQTDADWWINNRQRVPRTNDFYNMVGVQPLKDLLPENAAVFNSVTLAYGITEYSSGEPCGSVKNQGIESTVIQGCVCARIKGRTGWISLE